MTPPGAAAFIEAMERTWTPAARARVGPWMIRDGQGGGQRVSATTAEADFESDDLPMAEAAMRELNQPPLFMVRSGEDRLDAMLKQHGYRVVDPVFLYSAPTEQFTQTPVPPVSAFQIWPPLAIMADIWAASGVGPARLAVMDRVSGPKTSILARQTDQPAGTAFVGIHGDIALIHAIEVLPALRRQGVARNIFRSAGHWAQKYGAKWLGLAVTRANEGANSLYASLGMQVVGNYHYRKK